MSFAKVLEANDYLVGVEARTDAKEACDTVAAMPFCRLADADGLLAILGVYMTRDSAATASIEFETTGEITSLGAVGEELNRQVRGKPMLVYNAGQVLLVRDAARGWRVTGFKPAEFGDGR